MVVVTGTINSCNYATNLSLTPTSGVPLIGLGAAAPQFGTTVVAGGGTGVTSTTAYAPICGGTTSTGNLQSASTGLSTSGFVLTSTGGSSLPTFQAVSASGAVIQINGDSGSAVPSAGIITITASAIGMLISGGGSTLTLGGTLDTANGGTGRSTLTNHALLVGAVGSAVNYAGPTSTAGQILQSQGLSADPAFSTATYPATTTANQLLFSSMTNIVTGLTSANSAVLLTTSGGVPSFSSSMTNGQVIIGSTSATPAAATLTAGTGISITNGAGSITIASTGSEDAWTDEGTSFSAAVGNGYFITGTATATLPASPSQGNKIEFVVDTTSILTIQAASGQVIRIGAAVSAATGTAVNNARGDAVTIVYRSSDNAWIAKSGVIGTWTVT